MARAHRSIPARIARAILHRVAVIAGAVALTLAFFLVLPLIQTINQPPSGDLVVQTVDTARIPPPPPPPEEEPEEEPEPENEPPELQENKPLLDLSQLELALNPGFGDGLGGDFAVSLNTLETVSEDVDALFSMSDLDQKPRVIYQPGPTMNAEMRRRAPATVNIIFIVDQNGRVVNPIVQSSTDPTFERPALTAVRQWKFEPGQRNGRPVRFRMRVPITFPKGR